LIYSEIGKILQERCAIEDVLQTVLVKLIPKVSLLRTLERDKLINYIIKTAQTTSFKYIDKEKRTQTFSYIDDLDSFGTEQTDFDQQLLRVESRDEFLALWNALPAKHQHILELKYVLELSNEEIAADLGVSPDSVRMLLSRARNKLKELHAASIT